MTCICTGPQTTAATDHIRAVSIDRAYVKSWAPPWAAKLVSWRLIPFHAPSDSDAGWRQSGGGPFSRPTAPETAMHETNRRAATTSGSPSHNLARNAFFLLAGQVGSTALSVILTAVLARWLGVVQFGIYYLLAAVSMFAYVVMDWGQSAYLIRDVSAAPRG